MPCDGTGGATNARVQFIGHAGDVAEEGRRRRVEEVVTIETEDRRIRLCAGGRKDH